VFRRVGAESLLSPCRSAEYPTLAKRPSYSVLDTSRFESIVPGGLPPWRDALTRFLDELEVSSEGGGERRWLPRLEARLSARSGCRRSARISRRSVMNSS